MENKPSYKPNTEADKTLPIITEEDLVKAEDDAVSMLKETLADHFKKKE